MRLLFQLTQDELCAVAQPWADAHVNAREADGALPKVKYVGPQGDGERGFMMVICFEKPEETTR